MKYANVFKINLYQVQYIFCLIYDSIVLQDFKYAVL